LELLVIVLCGAEKLLVLRGGSEGAGEPLRPYPMSEALPIKGALEVKLELDIADDPVTVRDGNGLF
jgi:hypothetical protein